MREDDMNKTWLKNIPEQDIKDFANKYFSEYFWCAIQYSEEKGCNYLLIMCEDDGGYPEDYFMDPFGHLYYKKEIDEEVKDWYAIVKRANEGVKFNGITYPEAFAKVYNLTNEDVEEIKL